jgi:RNA polymerase sigma factor (sigma-70 family)
MHRPAVPPSNPSNPETPHAREVFATTRWTVVLAAQQDSSSSVRAALEQLCEVYWYPLYAYVRRRGYSQHDAEDLTQGFLAHLLAHSFLERVGREKGKFRSFLLASLKNYLADEHDRASSLKRGAGQTFISLDLEHAAERYAAESVESLSPDKLFDRGWAMQLLERARSRLEGEYLSAGKPELYKALRQFNAVDSKALSYADVAAQLNIPENTLKSLVHRSRQRYRQLLREEIAQTVSTVAEVDEEIRYLIQAAST